MKIPYKNDYSLALLIVSFLLLIVLQKNSPIYLLYPFIQLTVTILNCMHSLLKAPVVAVLTRSLKADASFYTLLCVSSMLYCIFFVINGGFLSHRLLYGTGGSSILWILMTTFENSKKSVCLKSSLSCYFFTPPIYSVVFYSCSNYVNIRLKFLVLALIYERLNREANKYQEEILRRKFGVILDEPYSLLIWKRWCMA